jgi:hypothetical protein
VVSHAVDAPLTEYGAWYLTQVEENGASTVSVEEEEAALAQAKYDSLSLSTSAYRTEQYHNLSC